VSLTRRAVLLSATAVACGRRKAQPFQGYCFVANQQIRTLAAVDLSRFRVRKNIALDAAPAAVVQHPSRAVVFVLAPETGSVFQVDAATLAITNRAQAGRAAIAMQIAPAKDPLWVLYHDPAALVEFPLDSLKPNRRIRLPFTPDGFDLSVHNEAAISDRANGRIAIASLAKATIDRTISTGAEPSLVSFQWDGKHLIAASQSERLLTIFETATGRVVVRLRLPLTPRHFCYNADGGQLFISGDGLDGVAIVFPYTTEVEQTVLAGHSPGAMAVTSKAPSYLLAANPDSGTVTVLDVDTRNLVAVVGVGQEPSHILITPDQEYALVLNAKSGDLAVIRVLSLGRTPDGKSRHYRTAPLFTMIPVGERPVSAAVVGYA